MSQRHHDDKISMLPLVNRISSVGTATAVLVALSLCAIVEQTILPLRTKPVRFAAGTPFPETPHEVSSAGASPRSSRASPLESEVQTMVLAQHGPTARLAYGVPNLARPIVRLSRIDRKRGWAFGTSAIPPPAGVMARPDVSVFVARAAGARWVIGLAGTKDFLRLLGQAPGSLISKDERISLTGYGSAAATKAKPGGGDTGPSPGGAPPPTPTRSLDVDETAW
ncbi:MAG: hypothetical protein JWN52_354 [Actinomycetia bacterium]|nr:hypothetical protein [Actinomycetes bacterium]